MVGLALTCVVGLFPPWERRARMESGLVVIQEGHAPIFRPPEPFSIDSAIVTHNVAFGRLFIYWTIIILGTGAAVVVLRREP